MDKNLVNRDDIYTNSVLIDFEAIYDIPFGIIRGPILQKYNDPDIFLKYVVNADTYTLRTIMYERKRYNPVQVALVDEDEKEADSILEQLRTNKEDYDLILKSSPVTIIMNLVNKLIQVQSGSTDAILLTVRCNHEAQVSFMKEKFPTVNTLLDPEFKVSPKPYDLIILNRYEDTLRYTLEHPNDMIAKSVWIPEFAYNMDLNDPTIPSFEISAMISGTNRICTYKPYTNYIKPLG